MKAKGLVHKFGDNVDTDVIIPARYLNKSDEAWLASHCMEDIDADFVNKVKEGDIMVAEANFGCGSSREHAPIAIKASGISCGIAHFRRADDMPEYVYGIGKSENIPVYCPLAKGHSADTVSDYSSAVFWR